MEASDAVEILERPAGYVGIFRIERYRLRHRKHGGGWTRPLDREVFVRGHGAAVLPYDPAADAVVLIEQFRIGALVGGLAPWQIEVPAGVIEDGEDAAAVARREALEETGCLVDDLQWIARLAVSPGAASETIALFCGRVDSRGAGGVHGVASEDEDIRVMVYPLAQALDLVAADGIANAFTVVALQWLALHRDEVRDRWLPMA